MVQRRQHAGFALETSQPVAVRCEPRGQNLDGDIAAKLRVARAIDLAHPAGAEQGRDLMNADPLPDQIESRVSALELRWRLQETLCCVVFIDGLDDYTPNDSRQLFQTVRRS